MKKIDLGAVLGEYDNIITTDIQKELYQVSDLFSYYRSEIILFHWNLIIPMDNFCSALIDKHNHYFYNTSENEY